MKYEFFIGICTIDNCWSVQEDNPMAISINSKLFTLVEMIKRRLGDTDCVHELLKFLGFLSVVKFDAALSSKGVT